MILLLERNNLGAPDQCDPRPAAFYLGPSTLPMYGRGGIRHDHLYDGDSLECPVERRHQPAQQHLCLDSDDVWAVGNSGTILFFNGTSWTAGLRHQQPVERRLRPGQRPCLAVGQLGDHPLFQRHFLEPGTPAAPPTISTGCPAIGTDFVWAVGETAPSSSLTHFLEPAGSGTINNLYGVTALDAVKAYTITAFRIRGATARYPRASNRSARMARPSSPSPPTPATTSLRSPTTGK